MNERHWIDRYWILLRLALCAVILGVTLTAGHFAGLAVASGYSDHDTAESAKLLTNFVIGMIGGVVIIMAWVQSGD